MRVILVAQGSLPTNSTIGTFDYFQIHYKYNKVYI